MKWLLPILLLLSSVAHAENPYEDAADYTYYFTQALIIADWRTTRDCAGKRIWVDDHYEDCIEGNPITRKIIGEKIDKRKLDILMIGLLIGNHYLQKVWTPEERVIYNTVHSVVRYDAVKRNLELGLEIRF